MEKKIYFKQKGINSYSDLGIKGIKKLRILKQAKDFIQRDQNGQRVLLILELETLERREREG